MARIEHVLYQYDAGVLTQAQVVAMITRRGFLSPASVDATLFAVGERLEILREVLHATRRLRVWLN